MQLIAHRGLWNASTPANSWSSFVQAFDHGFGIETDIRSAQGQLYISHDTIKDGHDLIPVARLLDLAANFPELPLFLNVKEDGLLPLLTPIKKQIERLNTVFFDMSVPELMQYRNTFPASKLAARTSDVEPYPSGIDYCDWLWLDCFQREFSTQELEQLCLLFPSHFAFVSPELHGRDRVAFWEVLKAADWLPKDRSYLCTDNPLDW